MRWLIPLAFGLWLVVPGARGDDWAQGLESYDGGDYSAALAAWRRAAASGNLEAVNAMAHAYRQGVGVSADPARAAALYRTTAEQGNVVAQLNLGDMMNRGVGVSKDAIGGYVGRVPGRGVRAACCRRSRPVWVYRFIEPRFGSGFDQDG